jgi:hypothetical protein
VDCATPMPKYKCHKEVWALKIKEVIPVNADEPDGAVKCVFVMDNIFAARIFTEEELFRKPRPKAGMYYVQYPDSYESFSPGDEFEKGYTLIGSDHEKTIIVK